MFDGNDIYWFTWTGAAKKRTLVKIGTIFGGFNIEDYGISLQISGTTIGDIINFYSDINRNFSSLLEVAIKINDFEHGKYDKFVPDDLLANTYTIKYLDTDAKDILKMLV